MGTLNPVTLTHSLRRLSGQLCRTFIWCGVTEAVTVGVSTYRQRCRQWSACERLSPSECTPDWASSHRAAMTNASFICNTSQIRCTSIHRSATVTHCMR